MKIRSATYMKALVPGVQLPSDLPIIAFLGRSNVGKSSFINSLTGQKGLCRSGSTPGVTQKVNLFLINKKIIFADLPGYGFAKMGKGDRKQIEQIIFWFLEYEELNLRMLYLLIDGRQGATEQDHEMIEYLLNKEHPITLILSKTDKLTHSEKLNRSSELRARYPGLEILPLSAQNGDGIKQVLQTLGE